MILCLEPILRLVILLVPEGQSEECSHLASYSSHTCCRLAQDASGRPDHPVQPVMNPAQAVAIDCTLEPANVTYRTRRVNNRVQLLEWKQIGVLLITGQKRAFVLRKKNAMERWYLPLGQMGKRRIYRRAAHAAPALASFFAFSFSSFLAA